MPGLWSAACLAVFLLSFAHSQVLMDEQIIGEQVVSNVVEESPPEQTSNGTSRLTIVHVERVDDTDFFGVRLAKLAASLGLSMGCSSADCSDVCVHHASSGARWESDCNRFYVAVLRNPALRALRAYHYHVQRQHGAPEVTSLHEWIRSANGALYVQLFSRNTGSLTDAKNNLASFELVGTDDNSESLDAFVVLLGDLMQWPHEQLLYERYEDSDAEPLALSAKSWEHLQQLQSIMYYLSPDMALYRYALLLSAQKVEEASKHGFDLEVRKFRGKEAAFMKRACLEEQPPPHNNSARKLLCTDAGGKSSPLSPSVAEAGRQVILLTSVQMLEFAESPAQRELALESLLQVADQPDTARFLLHIGVVPLLQIIMYQKRSQLTDRSVSLCEKLSDLIMPLPESSAAAPVPSFYWDEEAKQQPWQWDGDAARFKAELDRQRHQVLHAAHLEPSDVSVLTKLMEHGSTKERRDVLRGLQSLIVVSPPLRDVLRAAGVESLLGELIEKLAASSPDSASLDGELAQLMLLLIEQLKGDQSDQLELDQLLKGASMSSTVSVVEVVLQGGSDRLQELLLHALSELIFLNGDALCNLLRHRRVEERVQQRRLVLLDSARELHRQLTSSPILAPPSHTDKPEVAAAVSARQALERQLAHEHRFLGVIEKFLHSLDIMQPLAPGGTPLPPLLLSEDGDAVLAPSSQPALFSSEDNVAPISGEWQQGSDTDASADSVSQSESEAQQGSADDAADSVSESESEQLQQRSADDAADSESEAQPASQNDADSLSHSESE